MSLKGEEVLHIHKKPKYKRNYIGVELEMISPEKNRRTMAEDIVSMKLDKYINLGTDGSITPDGLEDEENCIEARILATESEIFDVLKKFLAYLNLNDVYVNNTCGLHVHIDMRNRNKDIVIKRLYKYQERLYSTVPEHRRYNDEYCSPVTPNDFTNYKFENLYWSRYKAINITALNKYNTIEIRLHHGSLNYKDISNWITMILLIVKGKTFSKSIKRYCKQKEKLYGKPNLQRIIEDIYY